MRSDLNLLGTLLGGVVLLAACDAPPPPALAPAAAPIVNGTTDTGDPATVYLDLGFGACSGTLVTPTIILTAAHCLEGVPQGTIDVFFGTNPSSNGTWIATTGHQYHPAYDSGDFDIGMITLASPAPAEIEPIPYNRANLEAHIDVPVRIVGFGATQESGAGGGIKRQGNTYLYSLPRNDVLFTGAADSQSWTCYGDSGGPNFATIGGQEVVIGVTSFGTTQCGMPFDGATRTDTCLDWLDAYVAANSDAVPPTLSVTAPADGATVAPGFVVTAEASDDKPGLRVEASVDGTGIGFDMSAPYEIAAPATVGPGLHTLVVAAIDSGGNRVEVTRAITVESECSVDGDCEGGFVCDDGVCRGELGTGCDSSAECLSGQCLVPEEGDKFCSKTCSDDSECPGDFTCELLAGSPARKCVPAEGGGGTCGCHVGGRGRAPGLAGLLGLVGLLGWVAVRRRRRV